MTVTHLDYFRIQAEEAQLVANKYLDEAGVTQVQRGTLRANLTFSGVGVVGERGTGPYVMYLDQDKLTIKDAAVWAACNLWGVCRTIKEMIDDPYYGKAQLRDKHLITEWQLKNNPNDQSLQDEWNRIKLWRDEVSKPPMQAGIELQKYLQWVKQPEVAKFQYKQMQAETGKKGGQSKRGYSADLDMIIQQVVDKVGVTSTDAIYSELVPDGNVWEFGCISDIHERDDKLWITYITGKDGSSNQSLSKDALDKRLRKFRKK